jgi:hypothetical protein
LELHRNIKIKFEEHACKFHIIVQEFTPHTHTQMWKDHVTRRGSNRRPKIWKCVPTCDFSIIRWAGIFIILPVVLYGCETWSLTLRGERKLRVFENMVLRRIFGPRRDEVTGEWRRLHNEDLNDLYSSPNIVRAIKSRRMRWAGHVARMGEERGVYRVLVGKSEGKRPLGRPRRRWVDNISMDLQEVFIIRI